MKNNEIGRRNVVKAIAIASASLVPAGSLATTPEWKPKLLSPAQVELVATLAERIIPETDTPGARKARVHEHIDLVLSEETPEIQGTFLAGLKWVEDTSRQKHGKSFGGLGEAQQIEVMRSMASAQTPKHDFFLDLRRRTTFAYYTSHIGIHEELGYKGHQVLGQWKGCPHPDHHGDAA